VGEAEEARSRSAPRPGVVPRRGPGIGRRVHACRSSHSDYKAAGPLSRTMVNMLAIAIDHALLLAGAPSHLGAGDPQHGPRHVRRAWSASSSVLRRSRGPGHGGQVVHHGRQRGGGEREREREREKTPRIQLVECAETVYRTTWTSTMLHRIGGSTAGRSSDPD